MDEMWMEGGLCQELRAHAAVDTHSTFPTPPATCRRYGFADEKNTLRTMKSVVQQRPETSQTSPGRKKGRGTRLPRRSS